MRFGVYGVKGMHFVGGQEGNFVEEIFELGPAC